MRDHFHLLAWFFSLGLHGLVASFLIQVPCKNAEMAPISIEMKWVDSSPAPSPSFKKHVSQGETQKRPEKSVANTSQSISNKEGHKRLREKFCAKPKAVLPSRFEDQVSENNEKALEKSGSHPGPNMNIKRKVYKPLPKYPWICRKRRQEGRVTLSIKTDEKGQVVQAGIHKSSGYSSLDQAALSAVKIWVFADNSPQKFLSIAFRLKG